MKKQQQNGDYPITWVTPYIATGRAPKSYDDLDILREQGIVAILNLCGEFCDLHQLEEGAGFEVFWLPTPDETAPSMKEMEEGLAWLDEAVYLGKKVLIHCNYGIGRTGTFLTAYLLRRGFTLKKAGKALKLTQTMANPSNFSQWWMLRRYGKKEGQLTLQEPDPQNRRHDELLPFFTRYELLLEAIERSAKSISPKCTEEIPCKNKEKREMSLIEALYLHSKANITLSLTQRKTILEESNRGSGCSLFDDKEGPLYRFRPASCRLQTAIVSDDFRSRFEKELAQLSKEVFFELFSIGTDTAPPLVKMEDVISGKFIQHYFQLIAQRKKDSQP